MNFLRKYRLQFDILAILVFAFAAFMFIDEYAIEKKKMQLVTGIASGLMAIIKLIDVIGLVRKRKN